jgi:hypothetical protein
MQRGPDCISSGWIQFDQMQCWRVGACVRVRVSVSVSVSGNVTKIGDHLIGIVSGPTVKRSQQHRILNREFERMMEARLRQLECQMIPRSRVKRGVACHIPDAALAPVAARMTAVEFYLTARRPDFCPVLTYWRDVIGTHRSGLFQRVPLGSATR